jgi:hypothetical protein
MPFINFMKKSQKQNANSQQQDSSGSIPSIEITKENIESGDYVSDESEYQEGAINESVMSGRRVSVAINNSIPPASPSYHQTSHAQQSHHQSPQHQYQPQVRVDK